jgi:Lar family restriction alleviation protein
MSEPLIPCPFCQTDELAVNLVDTSQNRKSVECLHCGAVGPSAGEDDDAIRYWNERQDLATLRRKLEGLQKERDELSRTIEGAHHDAMIDWPGSEVPLLGQVESLFSALRDLFNTKYSEALRVAGELAGGLTNIRNSHLHLDSGMRDMIDTRLAAYRALTADGAAGVEGKDL